MRIVKLIFGLAAVALLISLTWLGVEETGRDCVMAGLLIALAAQGLGLLLLLGEPLQAFVALFVPGYGLFALSRNGHYALVVGVYLLGASSLGVGTLLLS